MNIVLAGMPGCGKTTVAEVFSKLGKRVVDTDEEIVKRHGRIADIFSRYGEEHFRDLESAEVERVSVLGGVVVSTGGGCLLRRRNVEALKRGGKIVYLKTSPETLVKRLEGDTERPLIQGGVKEKIDRLYSERSGIYESSADLTVETDNLTPEQIVNIILEKI